MATTDIRPVPISGAPGAWLGRMVAVILGLLVAAGFFVCFLAYTVAARWTHPARSAIAETPVAYGMDYEDVVLTTEDGLRLTSWYIPSTNHAALIVLHGLGGNRASDLGIVKQFVGHGYGVLLPDLRAHGESEGAISTLSVHEVRDVRAALSYLQHRADVDSHRIGIYGASLGGATAIMAGAEITELRAVASFASFSSIEWVVKNQFSRLESVPGWLAPFVVAMGSWQTGVAADEIAPLRQIARISPRPVMIMHGDMDQTFVVENAQLLYDAAREPKELWIDRGVGHNGHLGSDDPYAAPLIRFFDAALEPEDASASREDTVRVKQ